MYDLLETVYEFQRLETRRDVLDDQEEARRRGLETLLRGNYAGGSSSRDRARKSDPIPVQMTIAGGFTSGDLHSVSRRGVAIVSKKSAPKGARTVIRVADPRRGIEYTFPGTVVWKRDRVIGVAFDGMPSCAEFLSPTDTRWWRPWFSPHREPLVA